MPFLKCIYEGINFCAILPSQFNEGIGKMFKCFYPA